MNPELRAKKKALINIRTIEEYNSFMDNIKLSDEQRKIADMVFINGYD